MSEVVNITVETTPWKNGVKMVSHLGENLVGVHFITSYGQIPHYLGKLERIHGRPVDYGWES